MKKIYYIVELEIALSGADFVFGFINVSHIPYKKWEEIFKDEITKERFLFDDIGGYLFTEEIYKEHRDFLDKEIPFKFNFNLFQYSIGLSGLEAEKYQKNYHEDMPPFLNR